MASIITQITDDTFQQQTIILPDGSSFVMEMYFMPMQYAWIFSQIAYKNFLLNGFRISNSPNMLYQYQNQIPFGLACFSNQNREPSQQQDFSSGASNLYLLSAEEVEEYTAFIAGGSFG